jgi:GNAT superfamily N-acetyltransferase
MPENAHPLIRTMDPADRAAALVLMETLNRHENDLQGDRRIDTEGADATLSATEKQVAEKGGAARVAELDGAIRGLMLVVFEEAPAYVRPDLAREAWVAELVVQEGYRGRGIARALLEEAEHIARDGGAKRLMIGALAANRGAIGVYHAFGFGDYGVQLCKPL